MERTCFFIRARSFSDSRMQFFFLRWDETATWWISIPVTTLKKNVTARHLLLLLECKPVMLVSPARDLRRCGSLIDLNVEHTKHYPITSPALGQVYSPIPSNFFFFFYISDLSCGHKCFPASLRFWSFKTSKSWNYYREERTLFYLFLVLSIKFRKPNQSNKPACCVWLFHEPCKMMCTALSS